MKPLTIEQFDVSDAFIFDPAMGRYGLTFAKFVSVETNKSSPPIRTDEELKVFMNKNDGKKSFSLAIAVDESNEEFFEKLERELLSLASTAIPRTKPEDFKLIKESKNYRNVYCKIYMNPSGKPKYLYSELIDSPLGPTTAKRGEASGGKRIVKPLEDSVFEKFKGSCVVRIIQAFSGKTKGISICADEIINYDSQKSYFDEFPEE